MRNRFVILLALLSAGFRLSAKDDAERFRVVEYNVENLFDTDKDSVKNDGDFTPDGDYHWTSFRYRTKLNNIAKTIIAIGEGEPPAVVGLCEIENRTVLDDLTKKTPIAKYGYQILHKESPDLRGVDVALLYQADRFKVISTEFIEVKNNDINATRDILFARGIVPGGDTLHVFMNHWPSRRGGEVASEKNRCYAASLVRAKVDSIFRATDMPYILIMGDFNDYPDNRSITEVLVANRVPKDMCCPRELYNLFSRYQEEGAGTYKFEAEWNVLDQMIVSGVFMRSDTFFLRGEYDAHIFSPSFLCVDGKTGPDSSPYRTYGGTLYKGGFSDHFPIYTDFYIEKK